MARIDRGDLRLLALEGLMVLFGVLAALLVDEWREDRALRAQAETARTHLVAEVRGNLGELESMRDIVSDRLALLDDLHGEMDGSVSLDSLSYRFGGYRQPDLAEGAWLRFSTSGIAERVPPELVHDAFALYAGHRYFQGLTDQVSRLVFSELNVDPARSQWGWHIAHGIMEQQIKWADYFIPLYRSFLDEWDGRG
jgi:hypothetical protein